MILSEKTTEITPFLIYLSLLLYIGYYLFCVVCIPLEPGLHFHILERGGAGGRQSAAGYKCGTTIE
jgi:hypothetical protein